MRRSVLSLSLSLSLSLLFSGLLLCDELTAQSENPGIWEPAFNHGGAQPSPPCAIISFPVGNLLAVHMSLIPMGPNRGKVHVFDHEHYAATVTLRDHRWSVFDPTTKQFANYCMALPDGEGDLFCAGHAWDLHGRLLVAGGTNGHCNPDCGGSKLVYLYDPDLNVWHRQPDLDEPRWYPSVVQLGTEPTTGSDLQLVLGGTHNQNDINSYQAFIPPAILSTTGSWQQYSPTSNTFPGPGPSHGFPGTGDYELGNYPRAHLLSNGEAMTAGFKRRSASVDHYGLTFPPGWWTDRTLQSAWRVYNSAVSFPILSGGNKDMILSTGGMGSNNVIFASVDMYEGYKTIPSWNTSTIAPLNHARWLHNTVILPDATILAIGGEGFAVATIGCSQAPVYVPELYQGGQWSDLAETHLIRNYHSTAILLPNGKVLVGGGEYRHMQPDVSCANPTWTWVHNDADYQIFQPPYLFLGPRPTVLSPDPSNPLAYSILTHGQPSSQALVTYAQLPPGISITQVVAVRPGSVTHHSDGNQRLVELAFEHVAESDPPQLTVRIPAGVDSHVLPKGYYMLFLLTNQGSPCEEAAWVKIR